MFRIWLKLDKITDTLLTSLRIFISRRYDTDSVLYELRTEAERKVKCLNKTVEHNGL